MPEDFPHRSASADPSLSVVIPTRNRAERLRGAIASVQAQTVGNLEILVVDDASTDATGMLVQTLASKDPRIRGARLERPEGAPVARNRGIVAARGEFIAFLDDDDRWLPAKAERQMAYLFAHRDAGAVSSFHEILFETSGRVRRFRGPSGFTRQSLLWRNLAGSCSFMMLRRSAFSRDVPRFDESLPSSQDWDYWLQLSALRRVGVVPEVLCRYTFHSASQLTGTRPKILAGERLLLERYRAEMSPACVAYREARLRLLEATDQRSRLRLHARFLRTLPARARAVLAAEALAARLGAAVGDPGLGARTISRMVDPRPALRSSGPERS